MTFIVNVNISHGVSHGVIVIYQTGLVTLSCVTKLQLLLGLIDHVGFAALTQIHVPLP